MKKLTLLILFSSICTLLSAQYEAVFNHYNLGHGSRNLINPAAAGFDGVSQLQFNLRAQWTGFEDAPKTYGALFNAPIGKAFGLGLGVYSEQAAQLNNLRLFLNYAFRFTAGEDWKISAGFSTEYQQMTLDSDVMSTPLLQQGDQLIDDFLGGKGVFDAAVAIYGAFRNNTFGGLTINNLVRNRLVDISGSQAGESTSALQFYTFAFGHKFDLYELNLTLEPSLVIRQVLGGPESLVDINLKAGFLEEQLIAGLSYRGGSANTLAILLGTRLSGFNLYYSYDVSFQRFQDYSVGSHEVTVAFSFDNPER